MEEFEKVGTEWSTITNRLGEVCTEYIKRILKEKGDMDFSDIDYPISVSYDGGNHPEYASNVFSTVYGVKYDKEEDDVILEIEDCNKYPLDNVNISELYELCDYIKHEYLSDN